MHVLYTLWFGYVWPSLKGNGPEALVQTVAYAAVAVCIYPPIRDHLRHLHAKLDHLIRHAPGVPSFHHPDFPSVHSITPTTPPPARVAKGRWRRLRG